MPAEPNSTVAWEPDRYVRGDGPQLLTPALEGTGLEAATEAARRLLDSLLRLGPHTALDTDDLAARLHALADEVDAERPDEEARLVEMWQDPRHDPATGTHNAVAPPLVIRGLPDGWVEGTVTLGIAYQGQPRMAHGGISALLLDHCLGAANGWAGLGGMTANLTLNYKRPTPLFEPLTLRARQVRVEGRKIWCEATLSARGEVCVTADALFIAGHLPRPQ